MLEFKNKKALSLIEMLVVLLIISTTVLTALGLILKSSIQIKENEIKDSVNGLLININESIKSPSKLKLKSFSPGTFTTGVVYGFKVEPVGNSFVFTYIGSQDTLSSCDSSSNLKYPISISQATVKDVCFLVTIKQIQAGKYEIKTLTAYKFKTSSSSFDTNYLITNRYEGFELI